MSSDLFYAATSTEVEHGDRVSYRSLLSWRRRLGSVVSIPSVTAITLNARGKQPQDWIIKFDDGTYTGWMYHPEDLQPPKRLVFVARADQPVETVTCEDLDAMEAEEETWSFGLLELIIIAVALLAVIAAVRLW